MKSRRWILLGLAAALAVGGFLSLASSPFPDGLERVAKKVGFDGKAEPIAHFALIPDYILPGIRDKRLATGLAGTLGTLVLFAAGWGMGRLLNAHADWKHGRSQRVH
jgi:cobalt/nickel transport protein